MNAPSGHTDLRPGRLPTPAPSVTTLRPGVEVIQPYAQFLNRRSEPRFPCDSQATLYLGGALVDCQVVNQSASGAQVLFDTFPAFKGDIWLIDVRANTVRCGQAAWSVPHKMGLKFSLMFRLDPAGSCPPRVPEGVWSAWRTLAGLDPKPPEDDVFFLD